MIHDEPDGAIYDASLSYDARTIFFSAHRPGVEGDWHIYGNTIEDTNAFWTAVPIPYRITRPQPGPWSPLFLSRADHDAPPVLEDWTLRVSHVSADGKTWEFDVRGSVTGQDGSGRSDQPFVSQSRRVKIDPAAWFRGFFPPLPDAYTIRWQVLPMFVDTYPAPKLDDPTKENSTTVVQGLINGKHTLEIIADSPASPPAITGVRTYRPPVKAD